MTMITFIIASLVLMKQLTLALSNNSCTCAAMESNYYEVNKTIPLIEQSLNILPKCGLEGTRMCNEFCENLAQLTRADTKRGDEFCKKVKKDIKNVKVSVFSKACNGNYTYTGLTFETPTCCLNGKRVDCTNI